MSKDRILYTECPLCNSENFSTLAVGGCGHHPLYKPSLDNTIVWKKCDDCTHIFTEGYFTDEACKILYGDTNQGQKVGNDLERNRYISARMIEKVLPFKQDGTWMDIGCGNGSLLFTAQEYGFTPIGVDIRDSTVSDMNAMGVETYKTTEEVHDCCDVISLCDVLEHVIYPGQYLESMANFMTTGGLLFVSLPNTDSMVWKEWNRTNSNPYWGEIEHYHNFSKQRLYTLIKENGFTPVRYGVSERYRGCMEVIAIKK